MNVIVLNQDNADEVGGALWQAQNDIDARIEQEMTRLQAEEVRRWRVDEDCTWGYIGKLWSERYPGWEGDQILGRVLCYRAACLLNEDPYDKPWN